MKMVRMFTIEWDNGDPINGSQKEKVTVYHDGYRWYFKRIGDYFVGTIDEVCGYLDSHIYWEVPGVKPGDWAGVRKYFHEHPFDEECRRKIWDSVASYDFVKLNMLVKDKVKHDDFDRLITIRQFDDMMPGYDEELNYEPKDTIHRSPRDEICVVDPGEILIHPGMAELLPDTMNGDERWVSNASPRKELIQAIESFTLGEFGHIYNGITINSNLAAIEHKSGYVIGRYHSSWDDIIVVSVLGSNTKTYAWIRGWMILPGGEDAWFLKKYPALKKMLE